MGIGRLDPGVERRIRALDREEHIVGEFVDEDRLAVIAADRQAQHVLFGTGHALAANAAGALVPIFAISLGADTLVVMLAFAAGEARIVAGGFRPVCVFGQVQQPFVARNQRHAIVVGGEPCSQIGPVREHSAHHVARGEQRCVGHALRGQDRNARSSEMLGIEGRSAKPLGRRTGSGRTGGEQRRKSERCQRPHRRSAISRKRLAPSDSLISPSAAPAARSNAGRSSRLRHGCRCPRAPFRQARRHAVRRS